MDINLKKSILASSLILSAATAHADNSSSTRYILYPGITEDGGLSYDRLFALLARERIVEYGIPVLVEINDVEGTLDLSNFDDFVLRIPLENAMVQPNRTEPTK